MKYFGHEKSGTTVRTHICTHTHAHTHTHTLVLYQLSDHIQKQQIIVTIGIGKF